VDVTDRLYDRLVYLGLIKPARDFEALHRALQRRGLVTRLGESADRPAPRPLDDMARAVERIHQLLADRGAEIAPCTDLHFAMARRGGAAH
jgi:hypothetical protein